jgi:hypothetical protein
MVACGLAVFGLLAQVTGAAGIADIKALLRRRENHENES